MVAVVATAAAFGAAAGAAGLVTFSVAGSAILGGALLYGGLAAASHILTPSAPGASGRSALAVGGTASRTVTLAASAPAQWVLGRARVAGVLAWYREDPENDRVVDVVIALSEGPCTSLQKLWVDGEEVPIVLAHVGDQPVDALRYQPGAPVGGTDPDGKDDMGMDDMGTDDPEGVNEEEGPRDYRGRIEVWFYRTGVMGRAPSSLAEVDPEYWTPERHGEGLCFVHVRLTQSDWESEDAEDGGVSNRFWQSFPNLSFLVKGLQVPRPTTTPDGEPGFEEGVEWSDNAAIIRYWFERERRGRPETAIDGRYLNRAFTICDETLDTVERDFFEHRFPEAIQIKRYSVNGVLRSDDNLDTISREFDFAWQGHVAERDGKLLFLPGTDELLSAAGIEHMDVAETGVVRFLGAQPTPALSERINATNGVMAQAGRSQWLEYEVSQTDHQLVQNRDGAVRSQDVPLRWLQWESGAHRLLSKHLRATQRTSVFEYLLPPGDDFRNVLISPGDTFMLTDIDRGLDRTRVMVVSQTVEPDWSVRLTVLVTPDGTFSDDRLAEGSRTDDPASVVPEEQPQPEQGKPNPSSRVDVTTMTTTVNVAWRSRGLATSIQIRELTGTLREGINNPGPNIVSRNLPSGVDRAMFDLSEAQALRESVRYVLELRLRGSNGQLSAPYYVEFIAMLMDTDFPPRPEGLEASASEANITMTWTPLAGHQSIAFAEDGDSFRLPGGTVRVEQTIAEGIGRAVISMVGLRSSPTSREFLAGVRFRRISDGQLGPQAAVDLRIPLTPTNPAAAPANLTASVDGTVVTLTWADAGLSTELTFTASPAVPRRLPTLSGQDRTTFEAADFQAPSTTVTYTVTARHRSQTNVGFVLGDPATTMFTVTRGALDPGSVDVPAPRDLVVTPDGHSINVTWRPVAYETVIELVPQAGGRLSVPDVTVGANESSASIDMARYQQSGETVTYEVNVRHLSSDGDVGPQASGLATIAILSPPPRPAGLETELSDTNLTVSWDLPTGLSAVVDLIEFDTSKQASDLYRDTVNLQENQRYTTFDLSGAQEPGTNVTYDIIVRYRRTVDGALGDPRSIRAVVTSPAVTGPRAPRLLRGTAGQTYVSASWQPLDGHETLVTFTEINTTKQPADLFTASRTVAAGTGAVSVARPTQTAGMILVMRVTAQYRRVSDMVTGETSRLTLRLTRTAREATPAPTALTATVTGSLLTLRWQGHGRRARIVYTATGQTTQTRNVSALVAGETSTYGLDLAPFQAAGATVSWTATVTLYDRLDGGTSAGTSASVTAQVTTPVANAPPAPGSLLTVVTGRMVTVTWTAFTGAETQVTLSERPQPGAMGTPYTETMTAAVGATSVTFDVSSAVVDNTLTSFDVYARHRRVSDMVFGPATQREAIVNELPVAPLPQDVQTTVSRGVITVRWRDQSLRTVVRASTNSSAVPISISRLGSQIDADTSQVMFSIGPYLRSGASAEYTIWLRHRNAYGQSGPAVRRIVTVTA